MRLDSYLFAKGFYTSRTKALQAVEKGFVLVNGKVGKPSQKIEETDKIEITENQKFVSLGGYKLEKALTDFNFSPKGLTFCDVGASTGGFTHCLLINGATKVYALDVGESLLDKSLVSDSRVVVVDRTNARKVNENSLPELCDGLTVDCSFISLKLILPSILNLLKENGIIIALIKPQFECGKQFLNKNGIVNNVKVHKRILVDIRDFCLSIGLKVNKITTAPKVSGKNLEFLIFLSKNGDQISDGDVEKILIS